MSGSFGLGLMGSIVLKNTRGIGDEDSRRENMIVYLWREMRIFVYC